jgi:hypothetical protein
MGMGFVLDRERGEFLREGIPVHLVTAEQSGVAEPMVVELEGISTVSLSDLIAMKLRSGSEKLLRAQDLADVIGLIRRHGLGTSYASRLPKDLRPAFRKLVKAIRDEGRAR